MCLQVIETAHCTTDLPFARCEPFFSFCDYCAWLFPGIHAFQFHLGVSQLTFQCEHILLHLRNTLPDQILFMSYGFVAVFDLGSGFQRSPGEVIAIFGHCIFSTPLPLRHLVGKLAFQSLQVLLFCQQVGAGHTCFFAGVFHLTDQGAQQLLRILGFFNQCINIGGDDVTKA